eukprot:TRINITY_DN14015_c0_g2_i5.p2 TRINITY_DN14015_c0_g2~~TRINITY_DN14015_c0_g2_i5.p2  ORF type:complete len:218 (-),score=13.83 TRINITY_DN14015_c0_g2_i5:415-1068(-)
MIFDTLYLLCLIVCLAPRNNQNQVVSNKQTLHCVDVDHGCKLPGFYIHVAGEPRKDTLNSNEEKYVNQLLQQYQQQDVETPSEADTQKNERYEKQILEKVDTSMIKFMKRVNRSPQQCARYGFGGQCLWPAQFKLGDVPKCPLCGADRVFELQLMSPLIACLQECCQWIGDNTEEVGYAQQAIDNWQWLTIACFTCSQNCQKKDEICQEEFFVVYNE